MAEIIPYKKRLISSGGRNGSSRKIYRFISPLPVSISFPFTRSTDRTIKILLENIKIFDYYFRIINLLIFISRLNCEDFNFLSPLFFWPDIEEEKYQRRMQNNEKGYGLQYKLESIKVSKIIQQFL